MKRPGHSRRATFTAKERRALLEYADWWVTAGAALPTGFIISDLGDAISDLAIFYTEDNDRRRDVLYSLAYDGTRGP